MIILGSHERKICWIWRDNPYKVKTKRIISNNYYGKIIYNGMCFTGSVYHWLVLSLSGIQRIIWPLMTSLDLVWPHLTFFESSERNPEEKTKFNCLLPEAYWYDVNRNGTIFEFHTTICYIISVGVYNLICQILERSIRKLVNWITSGSLPFYDFLCIVPAGSVLGPLKVCILLYAVFVADISVGPKCNEMPLWIRTDSIYANRE